MGAGLWSACNSNDSQGTTLLNVSYDPTRELYQEINTKFAEEWKKKTGKTITIQQSHGGSGSQARSVIEGAAADVVTLALAYDIDAIAKKDLIRPLWRTQFPHDSAPFTSTIVFLVRQGNPKQIHDWEDLIKPGVSCISSNPKTSGGARWGYLAAWGYALDKNKGSDRAAREFVTALFKNMKALPSGARAAANMFVQEGQGDVQIAWENEAILAIQESSAQNKFEIVVPSISILAETPVAVVDSVVDKHGTRELATAYLNFLYSEAGQEIGVKNHYRPRLESVAGRHEKEFPKIKLFTVDEVFGSWDKAQRDHFDDGGIFDQIYKPQ
ncbi:MAG: sulfate ABC transporter substrate-binding protein [Phycisphaerae bacterium]|nr:sulfate ABC transporter substrate-binding protein [Phycisphaerae bacterium]